jgi:hypothetical protein
MELGKYIQKNVRVILFFRRKKRFFPDFSQKIIDVEKEKNMHFLAMYWWIFLIGIVVCSLGPFLLVGSFVGAAKSHSDKGFMVGLIFMLVGLILTISEIACWILTTVGIIAAFMGK